MSCWVGAPGLELCGGRSRPADKAKVYRGTVVLQYGRFRKSCRGVFWSLFFSLSFALGFGRTITRSEGVDPSLGRT